MDKTNKKEAITMKQFEFEWEVVVQRSVVIYAETLDEAREKWSNGEFGQTDVNDEDFNSDFIVINGETYDLHV